MNAEIMVILDFKGNRFELTLEECVKIRDELLKVVPIPITPTYFNIPYVTQRREEFSPDVIT